MHLHVGNNVKRTLCFILFILFIFLALTFSVEHCSCECADLRVNPPKSVLFSETSSKLAIYFY